MKQPYRTEIDGMRALAVLAVVGFHAGVPGLGGGFAGVDVFFVISGYLITQVILRDAEGGGFSFAAFYERRVRRIMPALLAMMAAATVAAWALMLPTELLHEARGVISMALFSSNLYFWRGSGYFEPASITLPLLHTWSLAVEEQFYLIFPIFLMLARPLGRRWLGALIACIALVSFALDVWLVAEKSPAAFYFTLARAWELMLGALLALQVVPRAPNRCAGELAAWSGFALVIASFVLLDSRTPFPGWAALMPCLGAASLLWGAEVTGSSAAHLLGTAPLRVIGLASYSIYLWHWPFIVFAVYWTLNPALLPTVPIVAALLALPAGYLSWRYIETPFRGRGRLLSRRALFAAAALASLALMAAGAAAILSNGAPGRFGALRQLALLPMQQNHSNCFNQPLQALARGHLCRIGDPTARPSFLILGDSHVDMYYAALDARAAQHRVAGYMVAARACMPLLGLDSDAGIYAADCNHRTEQILAQIARLHLKAVILGSRWALCGVNRGIVDPDCAALLQAPATPAAMASAFRADLAATAAAITATGARAYFLVDDPRAALPVPDTMVKEGMLGVDQHKESSAMDRIAMKSPDTQMTLVNSIAISLAKTGMLGIIDPTPFLCGAVLCPVQKDGVPYYLDNHHLAPAGARLAAQAFEPLLQSLAGR